MRNCQYRILKNVHIGQRVRKTKDKKTVPFDNEPMVDVKIESVNSKGYILSHPSLPKNIWVDFHQIDIRHMHIEYGVIKNEITFVEQVMHGGWMELIRTDTLDYQELLVDKKHKEEANLYKVSDLKPGDNIISAICKEGNVMTFMGVFHQVNYENLYNWGYRRRDNDPKLLYIKATPKRAFFAIEENGKYRIKSYPTSNKFIKQLYKAEDKGKPAFNELFKYEKDNLNMLFYENFIAKQTYLALPLLEEAAKEFGTYDFIDASGHYGREILYFAKDKKDIVIKAMNFFKDCTTMKSTYWGYKNYSSKEPCDLLLCETKKEAEDIRNNRR